MLGRQPSFLGSPSSRPIIRRNHLVLEAFDREGILITFQVHDAASEFERVRTSGLFIDHPLREEPWGQRRFGLKDPAGVWVDVVEQIEPELGYWDRYT